VRITLVVNPAASSVTARRRDAVAAVLGDGHELDVVETTAREDARAVAATASAAGAAVVAVLGGDGTVNEAAHGLVGTATALAPLPGGSTNVLARTLGVPYDPVDAARALLASLARGAVRRVGVGTVEPVSVAGGQPVPGASRHFLFHLGAGFDAAVVRRIEAHPAVKRRFAHPAFAAAAVGTWLRGYDHHTRLAVHAVGTDGVAWPVAEGPYVVVSNSAPYTYVGRRGITLAPQADLGRPLALTVLRNLRAWLLVRGVASAVGRARFVTTSGSVVQRADLDRLRIAGDRPFPWQVDGEYLGEADRLDVRYDADALAIVGR
jgi:diacylglycerol kinase family enzyme